jgi:hypothetical protein
MLGSMFRLFPLAVSVAESRNAQSQGRFMFGHECWQIPRDRPRQIGFVHQSFLSIEAAPGGRLAFEPKSVCVTSSHLRSSRRFEVTIYVTDR